MCNLSLCKKELMIYLKTTEFCNLNCHHCYNGEEGVKLSNFLNTFNKDKTVEFIKQMDGKFDLIDISFHGGEPLLADPLDMFYTYTAINEMETDIRWGIQSNLSMQLDDDRKQLLTILAKNGGMGTSWDYDLRFHTREIYDTWRENVDFINDIEGASNTLIVSMSKRLVTETKAIDIIKFAKSIGFDAILFERITKSGNALNFNRIIPTSAEVDKYTLDMYNDTVETGIYTDIKNNYLSSILYPYVFGSFTGCRSRECAQRVMTINANGSISGCPNSAHKVIFGSINNSFEDVLKAPLRKNEIIKEQVSKCMQCEYLDRCNGDCYQLTYDDECYSPKSLYKLLEKLPSPALLKKIVL